MKPVLIAGVGNIFHGDDAFGVCVARRLAQMALPEGIEAVDFGIRGLDLAYALTGGCRLAVLVDTVQRGGAPGTLHLIEPEPAGIDDALDAALSPHQIDPASILRLTRAIGGDCARVLLVGCEPASFGDPEEGRMGLSDEVAGVVDEAAAIAVSLGSDWLRDFRSAPADLTHEEFMP